MDISEPRSTNANNHCSEAFSGRATSRMFSPHMHWHDQEMASPGQHQWHQTKQPTTWLQLKVYMWRDAKPSEHHRTSPHARRSDKLTCRCPRNFSTPRKASFFQKNLHRDPTDGYRVRLFRFAWHCRCQFHEPLVLASIFDDENLRLPRSAILNIQASRKSTSDHGRDR